VRKVVEREVTGGTRGLLPAATPEAVEDVGWLRPHFADARGRLRTSVHLLLVETPEARIVVDTGLGNDKTHRPVREWNGLATTVLDDLTAAGFAPESVDAVVCTHLHVDHVGWNTRFVDGRWQPTFPSARYFLVHEEYDHWAAEYDESLDRPIYFYDSIEPVAAQTELVDPDQEICAGVRLIATPGHTPGHVSVVVESAGERAVITGDAVHHPIQLAHPEWSPPSDWDPVLSAETRRRLFGDAAATDALLIGTHFAGPTAGRVRAQPERPGAFVLVLPGEA
jgi:glyoxylase-like metal-dependent hydrolase (beta-lactamase superfamily II)